MGDIYEADINAFRYACKEIVCDDNWAMMHDLIRTTTLGV